MCGFDRPLFLGFSKNHILKDGVSLLKMIIKMDRKMNRKGWVRVVEAFFAVLIVLGAVLVVMQKQIETVDISDVVYEKERALLTIIANNDSMRNEILINNTDSIDVFVRSNLPNNWDFVTNVCNIDMTCNRNTPDDRNVYVSETFITSNLTDFPGGKSKKLRLFIWRRR